MWKSPSDLIFTHAAQHLFLNQRLGQSCCPFLAEAGGTEIGVEVLVGKDNVFLVIRLVDNVVLVKQDADFDRDAVRRQLVQALESIFRQVEVLVLQWALLQSIGQDIVKAQHPCALGVGGESWDEYKLAQRYISLARAAEVMRQYDGDETAYNFYGFGLGNPIARYINEHSSDRIASND